MPVGRLSLSSPDKTFVEGVALTSSAWAKIWGHWDVSSGPGNCHNKNESSSVFVSVQQSGRPLVTTDNSLSVGWVSNSTTTMTPDSSCSVLDSEQKIWSQDSKCSHILCQYYNPERTRYVVKEHCCLIFSMCVNPVAWGPSLSSSSPCCGIWPVFNPSELELPQAMCDSILGMRI